MVNYRELKTSRAALVEALEAAGGAIRGNAVKCPFHEDQTASGSIFQHEGTWHYRCHATSCGFSGDIIDIRSKMKGTAPAHLSRTTATGSAPELPKETPRHVFASLDEARATVRGICEGEYIYANPDTQVPELAVLRWRLPDGEKTFRQLSPVPGGFIMAAPPKPWPLYNRSRLRGTDIILVVEGEKCVHALHEVGLTATTSPAGAGKAEYADWTPLAGKRVYLWPDFDEPGITHMRQVASMLERLDPQPTLYWVDPKRLQLDPKGDVANFLARADNTSLEQQCRLVEQVMETAEPLGPSRDVLQLIAATSSGDRQAISWPWFAFSRLTKALLPGTVTLICGDPGDGKSFLLLQTAAHWHDLGIKVAVFELEEDRRFHLLRTAAQRAGESRLLDDEWIRQNSKEAKAFIESQRDWLDEFGRCIHEAREKVISLPGLADWAEERAREGARVICIDPVTAAAANDKPWVADQDFMARIKQICRRHDVSMVLITHPRKGRQRMIGLDELAGGAAYSRFSQTVIWVERHKTLRTSTVNGPCGRFVTQHNRTLHLAKTRNATGHGLELAFQFSADTLTFVEQGVICE